MNKTYYYCIADFCFSISATLDLDNLLPTFSAFRTECCSEEQLLFVVDLLPQIPEPLADMTEIDISYNDLGQVRLLRTKDNYYIELKYEDGMIHRMQADKLFTSIQVQLCLHDRYLSEAFSSLLRIAFSQSILCHGGISVHASAVVHLDRAYLFMGKSGTGKSTHASLWLNCFQDSELLNDDNPIIRIQKQTAYVYGSPWSGKTPCYKNKRYRLGGAVKLVQGKENRFTLQESENAFVTLLPGCSAIHKDAVLYSHLCNTLIELIVLIPVGVLLCKPDKEAALKCETAFKVALA